MRNTSLSILIVAGLLTTANATTPRGPNAERGGEAASGKPAPGVSSAAMESLRLSAALAAYGTRVADPIALVQAAKIRKSVVPLLTPAKAGSETPGPDRTVERLLMHAAQIGAGNPVIAALVAEARAYRPREIPRVPAGVWLLHKQVKAKAADRAEVGFKVGQTAVVFVHSDKPAELNLFVYDEYNNLICADEAAEPGAQCRWRPRWDGSYLIDVRNKSEIEVEYELAINSEVRSR